MLYASSFEDIPLEEPGDPSGKHSGNLNDLVSYNKLLQIEAACIIILESLTAAYNIYNWL